MSETAAAVDASCLLCREYRERRVNVVQRATLVYRYVQTVGFYYVG